MSDQINLRILRIGMDGYGEPYTVNIRAVVESLEPLRGVTEKFRYYPIPLKPSQFYAFRFMPSLASAG